MNYRPLLKKIIKQLEKLGIINNIINASCIFFDEPKYYYYISSTNPNPSYFKKKDYHLPMTPYYNGGSSFKSNQLALLKSISESVERFCQSCFHKKSIIFSSYTELKKVNKEILDPMIYKENPEIRRKVFGWIKGYSITATQSKKCFIPAQLAYLNNYFDYQYLKGNYQEELKERPLTISITTGAAAGFSHAATLLTGLYEVAERDATMTTYLNKISHHTINLATIKFNSVQKIIESCLRYKIEVYLFDITNDLEIPVYLALLVDRTGVGPAVTVGSSANFNIEVAILSSIEESLMARPWLRKQMIDKKTNDFKIRPDEITNNDKMHLFWFSTNKIKRLNFLLQKKSIPFHLNTYSYSEQEVLFKTISAITKKGYSIYYVNLTINQLREIGYFVYKVIIPGFQPLYLNQTRPVLNIERLKAVAKFFGKKKFSINNFPHPFP